MKKSFYLTTTLPYVNAEPHIGFALELVQADIIARYKKSLGHDIFFNTGTDEHGLKIYRQALKAGRDPQKYVDEYADKFRGLKRHLNLYEDLHFIRTTDQHHVAAAQELWRRCEKNGDIELRKYKGLYCMGDEVFVKETDLVDGKCRNHPTMELVEIEEQNYFFSLRKYEKQLLEYLESKDVIVPEERRREAIQFVERGLEDFSISRVKERMPWGVPVPGDEAQVMYVWFDALTNYISTLGWPFDSAQGKPEDLFKKFWVDGETLQLAGKDQVRFQSIMWQAMLMSAGLPTTKKVFYHGFITSGGQKMSKSVGNVIDPIAIAKEYGADALRYFLARHVQPFEDSDFTMEKFKEAYNADLADGVGNAVARIMTLAEKHLDNPIENQVTNFVKPYKESLNAYKFNEALGLVTAMVVELDNLITTKEPFKLIKTDPEQAKGIISDGVRILWGLNDHLQFFMPNTSNKIREAILANKKPANLFPRKE